MPTFIEELVAPYILLDKSLCDRGDDTRAWRKKFSNNYNGASSEVIVQLNQIARSILEEKLKPGHNWLAFVDALWIFANHIDQQIKKQPDEMLPPKEKNKLVLTLLEAAYKFSPKYDYTDLEKISSRELSSHHQLLHSRGKARQFGGFTEEHLITLQTALKIAKYLAEQKCEEEVDPHAYNNRVFTSEMTVFYCLQNLNRFQEALEISLSHIEKGTTPHLKFQAHSRTADVYFQLAKEDERYSEKAMFHLKERNRYAKDAESDEKNRLQLNLRLFRQTPTPRPAEEKNVDYVDYIDRVDNEKFLKFTQ